LRSLRKRIREGNEMELAVKIDDADHVSLIQGEDRSFVLRLIDKDTGAPIALNSNTEVKFEILDSDGRLVRRSSKAEVVDSVDTVNDKLAIAGHGYSDGDVVQLTTTGTLPAGLSLVTNYYVKDSNSANFKLSASLGGAAIDITDAGSGVHSVSGVGMVVASPNDLGKATLTLGDHVTSVLEVRNYQDAEFSYTIGANTRIVKMARSFSISSQVG